MSACLPLGQDVLTKLSLVATEKSALEEKLTREFEVLEGKNCDLEKKRELSNESLGKKLAVVEERLAMLKGVFSTVSSANEESNRDSGNDSGGWIIPMSDSHDKASSLKSCQTKPYPSLGNPSSKSPPQRESKDSEGITNGDQLGVMTEGSFLEYELEAGGYSENSINCNRKRNINGSEDDSDSLGVNKKTKRLLESGCKKNSLPNDLLKNLNPSAPGVSKANLPPKFSSASIEQYESKNGRHEISELHFRKSVSGAVGGLIDGTNRSPRSDPHEPSPVTKAVAGFRSGKEIEWKHRADMLSAFANNPELCIAAVCALYRRTISEKVSRNSLGFSSFDCVSGTTAAKYLINGDPANKLSKSVSEVQQDRPAILKTCETLAIRYGVQLFEIYQKKLDPFFRSKG
ncbi:hypothetical protein LIER_37164 [Lithospermum erythrorhizon]|uniref:Uncharacterized protein n=1 Tax=Lithospermum erythrorhizon TaxID=34254 RepID=A0AAV3PHF0_LITER